MPIPLPDTSTISEQTNDADRITTVLVFDFDAGSPDNGEALLAAFTTYMETVSALPGYRTAEFSTLVNDVTVTAYSGTWPPPE